MHPNLKNAPNLKKMPPIKKTFSNSTNTFAPNLKKKCPQLKFFFQIPLTNFPLLPPI